jgi:membrane glycosyltransferase
VADKIKEAAQQIAADSNAVAVEPNMQQSLQVGAEPNKPAPVELTISLRLRAKHIAAIVRFLDFILIPCSLLYCLTILFALKVSLIGRLGGINHIARAFFLSLLFVVLLLPWQLLFAPVFAGAMFTPSEMMAACQADKTKLAYVSMILRFSVYWVLVVLLLLAAQMRSMRWAKATLRRLDVM